MFDKRIQQSEDSLKLPNLPHRYGNLSDEAFEGLLKLSYIGTEKLSEKLYAFMDLSASEQSKIDTMTGELRRTFGSYFMGDIDGDKVLQQCQEISNYVKGLLKNKALSNGHGWFMMGNNHFHDCRAQALIPFYISDETVMHQTSIESFVGAIKEELPITKDSEDITLPWAKLLNDTDLQHNEFFLAIKKDLSRFTPFDSNDGVVDLSEAEQKFMEMSHFTSLSPKLLLALTEELEWARSEIISKTPFLCSSLENFAAKFHNLGDMDALTIPTQRTITSNGQSIIIEWETPGYAPLALGINANKHLIEPVINPYVQFLKEIGGDLKLECKGFSTVATITCPPCQTKNEVNEELGLLELSVRALTSQTVELNHSVPEYRFRFPHGDSRFFDLIIDDALLHGKEYTGLEINGRNVSESVYDILNLASKLDTHHSLSEISLHLGKVHGMRYISVYFKYSSPYINGEFNPKRENSLVIEPAILASPELTNAFTDVLQAIPCKNIWFMYDSVDPVDLFSALKTTVDSVLNEFPDAVLDLTQSLPEYESDGMTNFDAKFYDRNNKLLATFKYDSNLNAFLRSYQAPELISYVVDAFDKAVGYDPTNQSKPLNIVYNPYFVGAIQDKLERQDIIFNSNFVGRALETLNFYASEMEIGYGYETATPEAQENTMKLYKELRKFLLSDQVDVNELSDGSIELDIL